MMCDEGWGKPQAGCLEESWLYSQRKPFHVVTLEKMHKSLQDAEADLRGW